MKETNSTPIVVEYYGDPTKMIDDHNSEQKYLTQVSNREFRDMFEAVKFLSECKHSITKIEDILPFKKNLRGFKLILPERNIRITDQAIGNIETKFGNEDEGWG